MTAYCTEPQKPFDFAYQNKAVMVFPKLKDFSFKIVSFSLPEISIPTAIQPNPLVNIKHPAEKMIFGTLNVDFVVSENFSNWFDIYSWMRGLGKPHSHDEYKNKQFNKEDMYLMILSAYNVPVVRINFEGVWPTALSPIRWSSQVASTEPIITTASFEYTKFEYVSLT